MAKASLEEGLASYRLTQLVHYFTIKFGEKILAVFPDGRGATVNGIDDCFADTLELLFHEEASWPKPPDAGTLAPEAQTEPDALELPKPLDTGDGEPFGAGVPVSVSQADSENS